MTADTSALDVAPDGMPAWNRGDHTSRIARTVGAKASVPSYDQVVRPLGIASGRDPAAHIDERSRLITLTFWGTSDARSSVDRDTRLRITLPLLQAARLWHLLGNLLSDEEKLGAAR